MAAAADWAGAHIGESRAMAADQPLSLSVIGTLTL
jgi:hypothetical protein